MGYYPTVILISILWISSLFDVARSAVREFSSESFGCEATGNVSTSYRNNINALLSEFMAQATLKSFYNTSVGDSPDAVFGYFMCRGDLQPEACRDCIEEGRDQYAKSTTCKAYPTGSYDSDTCIFRYTNHSTYGVWEKLGSFGYTNVGVKVSNYQQYNQTLSITLESLINEAAFGSNESISVLGFATKEADLVGGGKLYSLAQCTPDIVGVKCNMCLRASRFELMAFDGYEGAKIISSKCLLKYDNQQFYDLGREESNKADGLRQSSILVYSVMFLFMYCANLL